LSTFIDEIFTTILWRLCDRLAWRYGTHELGVELACADSIRSEYRSWLDWKLSGEIRKERRAMRLEDLRQSPMMNYLLDALDSGEDIGHQGWLTFAIVAHHFLERDELVAWLSKDGDTDKNEVRAGPAGRGEGLQPAAARAHPRVAGAAGLPDCPNPEDPDACNVYNELQFPHDAYQDSRSTARNGKPPTPRFCTLLT